MAPSKDELPRKIVLVYVETLSWQKMINRNTFGYRGTAGSMKIDELGEASLDSAHRLAQLKMHQALSVWDSGEYWLGERSLDH